MLAGAEGLAALRLSEQSNQRHEDTANYISIRIRFFDDIAQEGAAQGVRQVVLPASGSLKDFLLPRRTRREPRSQGGFGRRRAAWLSRY